MSAPLRTDLTLTQTAGRSVDLPGGATPPLDMTPGRIVSGSDALGYTVSVLGDDGTVVTTEYKVRPMPGDVVLLYQVGNPQPYLLRAGSGGSTVYQTGVSGYLSFLAD